MNEITKFEHIKITPYSLEFSLGTTWEEARQIGIQLMRQQDQLQWYLGDWILYCTSISGWGKRYEAALEKTAYPYQSLRNCASVAHRFPPTQRQLYCQQYKLSFTRFQEVASLNDAQVEYLFKRSAEEGWSCARLRIEVQKLKSPVERTKNWLRVNILDPLWRTKVLSIPHIDKKIAKNKKPVYILTGMDEIPELTPGDKK
jgi:hypothetical protein